MPVVLSMQFGVYIQYHRVQHGYVPMPLRLLVQHFLHVILLTDRGLCRGSPLIGEIARGKQMTVKSASDRPEYFEGEGWSRSIRYERCDCQLQP